MTWKSIRSSLAATSFLLTLVLCGCAATGDKMNTAPDESLSVQGAKEIAQRTESDIAAIVPTENVLRITQNPTGVLMSCGPDRAYQWAGGTNVFLQGTPDISSILAKISESYADRPGFTTRDASEGDLQLLQILGEHDAGYLVGPSHGGAELLISSFSPCFYLPNDVFPGDEF